MAITDNSFTKEEAVAAISANPALVETLKEVIPQDKYVVTPKADYDNLESTHIAKYVSTTAPQIEAKIKEITGIEKTDANEKWFDYAARATTQVVTEKTKIDQELTTLKASSNITEAERERIKVLEGLQTAQKTELDNLKKSHEAEVNQLKTGNAIINDIAPIRSTFVKEPKMQKAISIQHEAVIKEMQSVAKVEPTTGKTIFFKADGKPELDANGNFKTAADIYKEKMSDFIDAGRKITGAGGKEEEVSLEGLPADVKTQQDLTKHIQALGKKAGTPEFTAEWKKFNGSKLPRG